MARVIRHYNAVAFFVAPAVFEPSGRKRYNHD